MAEYTYEDIIMDPDDPRLEGAIGKECYFSDYPKKLLNSAIYNLPEYLDCLTDIRKEGACTFVDKNGSGWTLIIIKKEEPKPKYVPFESKEEFIEAFHYHDNANYSETEDILMNYGMWLKLNELYVLVTCISDEYIKTFESCYFWNELLENFEFLDGSPCGKEVKDECHKDSMASVSTGGSAYDRPLLFNNQRMQWELCKYIPYFARKRMDA